MGDVGLGLFDAGLHALAVDLGKEFRALFVELVREDAVEVVANLVALNQEVPSAPEFFFFAVESAEYAGDVRGPYGLVQGLDFEVFIDGDMLAERAGEVEAGAGVEVEEGVEGTDGGLGVGAVQVKASGRVEMWKCGRGFF